MASSVINLNTVNVLPAGGSSIGAALGEVAQALSHLTSALARKVLSPSAVETRPLTAYEEAEQLRTYAADIQSQDPDFAQDLFAAADRHEIEAAALATAAR